MKATKDFQRYVVCRTSELPPGKRTIIRIPDGRKIGVYNLNGTYYALKSLCPHHGGPLCEGETTGTSRPKFVASGPPQLEWFRLGEIVRCPWHGWEFDIKTGVAVCGPGLRTATYPVAVTHSQDAVHIEDPRIPGPVETFPVDVEADVVVLDVPR